MREDIQSIISERDKKIPKKERWHESKNSPFGEPNVPHIRQEAAAPAKRVGPEAKIDGPEDPIMWSDPNVILDEQRQEVAERHLGNPRKNPQRRR